MENDIINQMKMFCVKNNIKTSQILAITIQSNRSTDFASLIIDFENDLLLPNYPMEMLTANKEMTIAGNFLICYKEDLKRVDMSNERANNKNAPQVEGSSPFCCANLPLYRGESIHAESVFQDFVKGQGHHPNIVYEVKRLVNNGPLVSTKYFTLINNNMQEVQGNFTQKMHAFKNYKCTNCNLFYAVDLYSPSPNSGFNYHHMRLNPFEKKNLELLKQFFSVALA